MYYQSLTTLLLILSLSSTAADKVDGYRHREGQHKKLFLQCESRHKYLQIPLFGSFLSHCFVLVVLGRNNESKRMWKHMWTHIDINKLWDCRCHIRHILGDSQQVPAFMRDHTHICWQHYRGLTTYCVNPGENVGTRTTICSLRSKVRIRNVQGDHWSWDKV